MMMMGVARCEKRLGQSRLRGRDEWARLWVEAGMTDFGDPTQRRGNAGHFIL